MSVVLKIRFIYPLEEKPDVVRFITVDSLDDNLYHYCRLSEGENCFFSFDEYYHSSFAMTYDKCFPYILRNGQYEWNVPYETVSIREFISTNQLSETDTIYINVNNFGGNGEGLSVITGWIVAIWPTIKNTFGTIANTITIVDGCKKLYDWIKKKGKPEALDVREMIQRREEWTLSDLKSVTGLSDEVILDILLISSGFEMDDDKYIKNNENVDKIENLYSLDDEIVFGSECGEGQYLGVNYNINSINKKMAELYVLSDYYNSDCYEAMLSKVNDTIQCWEDYIMEGQDFQYIVLKKKHKRNKSDIKKLNHELEFLDRTVGSIENFMIDKYENHAQGRDENCNDVSIDELI